MNGRVFVILCFVVTLLDISECISTHPILLVVSFDGFRYDYIDRNVTPNLFQLRTIGTYSDYFNGVFPTKTFPNHFSIATGLFAESHGVIDNSFYDVKEDKLHSYDYEMFHYDDNNVVPIWTLNEEVGSDRYSGVMMWPGEVFAYRNRSPTYAERWSPNVTFERRIDTALQWIEHPTKPANLVMLYLEQPDDWQHVFGPDSSQALEAIQSVDALALYLKQQLDIRQLTDKVNVVHLSDHGMVGVRRSNIIDLSSALLACGEKLRRAGSTASAHIIPQSQNVDACHASLKDFSERNGHYRVYRQQELPDEWRIKNNPRIPPIYLLADVGYGFDDMHKKIAQYPSSYNVTLHHDSIFGVHGYEPTEPKMRPFFQAYGPAVAVNRSVSPFDAVDLYSLFCKLIDVEPGRTDGNFENVRSVLRSYNNQDFSTLLYIVVISFVGLGLICGALGFIFVIIRRRNSAQVKKYHVNK